MQIKIKNAQQPTLFSEKSAIICGIGVALLPILCSFFLPSSVSVTIGLIALGILLIVILLSYFPKGGTLLIFQPTGVLLQEEQRKFLPYQETSLHLLIVIRQSLDRADIHRIIFSFLNENKEVRIAHRVNFKKLFPIVEQCSQFVNFTYEVITETSGGTESQYKEFVEEQVQNHLRYGVHLPFPSGTMKYYMSFVISYFSAFCCALYFGTDYLNETSLFYRLSFLSFFIFMGVLIAALLLIPFYRAKHQLDKFRLDEFRKETFLKEKQ